MVNKFMLFLSSYIPLYILLILKNILERITNEGRFINICYKYKYAILFDGINDWAICALLFLTIISFYYLRKTINRQTTSKRYKIVDVLDETGNIYFTYISIYLLSCMGLTLNSIVDCFVFVFVMLIVGYIYISNNMVYMNPVINLMGYKVYTCVLDSCHTKEKGFSSIVVAPNTISINKEETINGSGKQNFIFVKN